MMKPEVYEQALSRLNDLETQSASLRESIHEGIVGARDINNRVRQAQAQQRSIDSQANELRQAIKHHENEARAKELADKKAALEAAEKQAKEQSKQ